MYVYGAQISEKAFKQNNSECQIAKRFSYILIYKLIIIVDIIAYPLRG